MYASIDVHRVYSSLCLFLGKNRGKQTRLVCWCVALHGPAGPRAEEATARGHSLLARLVDGSRYPVGVIVIEIPARAYASETPSLTPSRVPSTSTRNATAQESLCCSGTWRALLLPAERGGRTGSTAAGQGARQASG
jgi:hypothetical protein